MITAPQFSLTRMHDSGVVQQVAENQPQSVPQSFMDMVRDAAETLHRDNGSTQETSPESRERAIDDIGSPALHEGAQGVDTQMELLQGRSHSEKNLSETERQHQIQDQGTADSKHMREYDAAVRTNKGERGESTPGKKIENSRDADVTNSTREHKNVHMADVQAHAQAVIEALRTVQEPSGQLKEFERRLKAFQEQFDSADSARKMQLVQEFQSRVKDIIGQIEGRDENGRSNNDAYLANLKGRFKALAESLERGRQGGGERREDAGNASAGFKENSESHISRERSSLNEIRFEIGKQTDVSARTEGAANAALRGTMLQTSAPVVARVPFMNEQFEMLMQQARITVRDARNGNFTMNLYPETLGRVNVNLGLEDGVLVGRFLVDTPQAREAMMESMDRLLAQLADAGIEVGAFQVNVRGERDRLVQNLQGYLAENRKKVENEGRSEYDAQIARTHDGLLDVIA